MAPNQVDTLSDRWLRRLKNDPFVASIIVVATIVAAIVAFWGRISDFYRDNVQVPVSMAAFNLAGSSESYINDTLFTCKFDGKNVRTFMSPASAKSNRSISLDFVFSNVSKTEAVITAVDLVVSDAEQVAGGTPGIIVPNHTYILNIKHQVGTQSFRLIPAYRIPANDTGSFTITFNPATRGVGLCWIMEAVFKTSLGSVKSDKFSLIMSNF